MPRSNRAAVMVPWPLKKRRESSFRCPVRLNGVMSVPYKKTSSATLLADLRLAPSACLQRRERETLQEGGWRRLWLLTAQRPEQIDDRGRNGEPERHGGPLAAQFKGIHYLSQLRVLPRLHAGEGQDAANDIAKVVGGGLVACFRANHGANAVVHLAADRKPGHWRQLLLDFRRNQVGAGNGLDVRDRPGVAVVEVADQPHDVQVFGDVVRSRRLGVDCPLDRAGRADQREIRLDERKAQLVLVGNQALLVVLLDRAPLGSNRSLDAGCVEHPAGQQQ